MIGTMAKKEFRDYLTSRRFLIFLSFLLIVAILSLVSVKLQMGNWMSYDEEASKPHLYSVMWGINSDIIIIGGMFALALGFDAITREREERTLKVLMSHPVFRDQVILGKILGGAITLAVAVVISALAITGAVMWTGITIDSYARLAVYFLFMYLYLFLFFTMAVAFSTYTKSSGNSLMYALVAFITLTVVLVNVAPIVAHVTVGPRPKAPPELQVLSQEIHSNKNVNLSELKKYEKLMEEYNNMTKKWSKRYWKVQRYVLALSPMNDFETIANYVLNPHAASESEMVYAGPTHAEKPPVYSLSESLSFAKTEIIVMLSYIVLLFVLAYLGFVRSEIR